MTTTTTMTTNRRPPIYGHFLPIRRQGRNNPAIEESKKKNAKSNSKEEERSLRCAAAAEADCICVGSGRFLRSALIPALNGFGMRPAILQTRGRNFLDMTIENAANARRRRLQEDADDEDDGDGNGGGGGGGGGGEEKLTYEVDTILPDGSTRTELVRYYGAGTLGTEGGMRAAIEDLLGRMTR